MKALRKVNSSKTSSLVCERLAKAPRILMKESSAKTRRVAGLAVPKKKKEASSPPIMKELPRRVNVGDLENLAGKTRRSKEITTTAESATIVATPWTPPSMSGDSERVTILKSRYADTIMKAQRQLFGEAAGTKQKQTTEELRRAAREALEKVEWSVEVEDSHKSVKDLERLCGWPISYHGGFFNSALY